ncbi:gliding motility-associated C-terminal domain-containing protein, partial [Flavobacterium frigidarium]
KSPIDAIDDVAGPINGVAGGDSGINVLDNDTLNGTAVNPADVVITSTPNGPLTVNTDGTVTVAPNTPAGEYTVQYTICEVLNPTNCDTATVTVTVEKSPIDAIDDVAGPINGVAGGDSGINVLDNDTLNGTAVNPADVVITSTPNGPLTVNTDGTVTVAPNTPAGEYTVQYTICEVLNPTNCDTATVTVTVEKSPIDAVDDTLGPINGNTGGTTPSVLTNDTLNGTPVNPADVVITSTPNGPLTVNPADGTVTVAPNTPAGEYTVQYTICEVLNPTNCDTATVTVTVDKSPIDAVDDTLGPINGNTGGTTPSVLTNDTLNGTPVNPADVVITSTPNGPLTVNPADGTVTVAPNTPAGEYTVQYTICEVLNPTNCDTATVTVTVEKSPIDAVDDTLGPINGNTGGTTPSVLTNDTLNGTPVNPADVVITSTPNGPLTVNPADGTVTVAPNTPAGEYTVQYTICEVLNPTNCDTATVTVTVEKSPIDAVNDTLGPIDGGAGGTTPSVLTNDTLNGTPVNPADVVITSTPNGPLTVNPADGTVTVAPNTPAGEYTVEYTICEVLNPTNCDTATVTVTVIGNSIVANDDNYTTTVCNTTGLAPVGNIFDNDLVNGSVFTADQVNFRIVSGTNNQIAIDALGNITLNESIVAGVYNLTYEICDKLSVANCSTADIVVNVGEATNDLPTVIEEVCNSGVDTYDLNTLLPTGVPTTGTWVDDNTGKLVGSIFSPLDVPVGTYNFKYTVSTTACPINMTVNMEVNDDCGIVLGCGAIEVHNAFSPNNDGINDIFVIDNIADVACYPENEVEIYNRWGVLVYKVRNYDNQNNSFRGISNGRTTISQSEGLPTGTYFYILTYKSVDGLGNIQNNKKDGYLYLSR